MRKSSKIEKICTFDGVKIMRHGYFDHDYEYKEGKSIWMFNQLSFDSVLLAIHRY